MQSVPARREIRKRLLASLPQAIVVEDDGPPPPNPWRGYQRCLRSIPEQATHAVVIQDDAIVCRNFVAAVERIADAVPEHPVCLFIPAKIMRSERVALRALKAGQRFVQLLPHDFLPVVATLWPRAKAEHLLAWAQTAKLPGMPNPRSDDAVAGHWMRTQKQAVYATLPSLVEHPDDVEPVKGGHHRARAGADRSRSALSFCTGDPLLIEWKL